jgi:hypothetical protein
MLRGRNFGIGGFATSLIISINGDKDGIQSNGNELDREVKRDSSAQSKILCRKY